MHPSIPGFVWVWYEKGDARGSENPRSLKWPGRNLLGMHRSLARIQVLERTRPLPTVDPQTLSGGGGEAGGRKTHTCAAEVCLAPDSLNGITADPCLARSESPFFGLPWLFVFSLRWLQACAEE